MAKKKETAEQEQFQLEEAFDRIEALLEKLQDKDVTLEESFGLYQEGMGLLKLCNENIDHVEKQMLQLLKEMGLTTDEPTGNEMIDEDL